MSNLKLVVDNTPLIAIESHARPICLRYYRCVRDDYESYSMLSRAKTIRGAVRAAVLRALFEDHAHCKIYHQDGHFMASVTVEKRHGAKRTVQIFGYFREV